MSARDVWRGPGPDLVKELLATIHRYIQAFYNSDAAELAEVFHPQAHLFFVDAGTTKSMTVEAYLDLVNTREPLTIEGRLEEIRAISFVGTSVAVAQLMVENHTVCFDDCLTLLHDGSGWKATSKAYSARPK